MVIPEWLTEPAVTATKGVIATAIGAGFLFIGKWFVTQFRKLDAIAIEQTNIAQKQATIDATITGFDGKLSKLDDVASNQGRTDKALDTFDKTLGGLKESVKKIEYEMTPNSGGSMKDALGRIEKQQGLAEGVLRSRIESADDIAVYCDPSGEITSVTAGYTELTGLDAISSQREKWKLCIHPDDIAATILAWHESLKTGNTFVADIRYTHVMKGGVTPCKVITSPVLVKNQIVQWASRIKPLAPTLYPTDPDYDAAMLHVDPASRSHPKP